MHSFSLLVSEDRFEVRYRAVILSVGQVDIFYEVLYRPCSQFGSDDRETHVYAIAVFSDEADGTKLPCCVRTYS